MVDNEQNNDEYKFVELDALDGDSMGELETEPQEGEEPSAQKPSSSGNINIRRNAIIVVVVVVIGMLTYKIFGHKIYKKTGDTLPKVAQPVAQIQKPPVNSIVTQTPVQQPMPVVEPVQPVVLENNPELTRKVSAIELSQASVRTEVGAVSQQVNAVSNNINSLNNQIANLNQVITNLSGQLSKQTEEITLLMQRTQPKRVVKPVIKSIVQRITYTIQAVIPGRAWLIGSNGSTLTVREGSKVEGYGVVKLIDSIDGRVLTSSGQVIKFSQEDS
jgi:intracellular multiplication protein IcmG